MDPSTNDGHDDSAEDMLSNENESVTEMINEFKTNNQDGQKSLDNICDLNQGNLSSPIPPLTACVTHNIF
jgi:hypothetical protein